jgi:hypothetical protein
MKSKLFSGLVLLCPLLLVISFSCHHAQLNDQPDPLSPLKNYKAIPAEFLGGASIAFIDSNKKNTPPKTFAELELTRQGFLLIPDSLFASPQDARAYVLQNENSFKVSPNDTMYLCPKCELIRRWHDPQSETIIVPCYFTFYNPHQTARLMPVLNKLGIKQAFTITLPNTSQELIYFACAVTVKGTIECHKPCCSREFCRFYCSFGVFAINHEGTGALSEFFIPCGINNCDGSPPGDGGSDLHSH